jgi:hypothetical protein
MTGPLLVQWERKLCHSSRTNFSRFCRTDKKCSFEVYYQSSTRTEIRYNQSRSPHMMTSVYHFPIHYSVRIIIPLKVHFRSNGGLDDDSKVAPSFPLKYGWAIHNAWEENCAISHRPTLNIVHIWSEYLPLAAFARTRL